MGRTPIHVTSPDKVPKEPHYAIFKFFSVSTSTYEANDGSESGVKYEAYLDKGAWIAEIEHLEKNRGYDCEPYVAVKVGAPAKPVLKVDVQEPQ